MPLDTLHADHIGATGGGFELQRANNALMRIVGLDGDENNLFQLSLASFPVPKQTVGIIEVAYLNEKRKFAGMPTFDDLTVIFNDYVSEDTALLLNRWFYQIHDPVSGKQRFKQEYAKEGRVTMYGPDGTGDREYEMQGVWPSALDGGEIDFATEDGVKINLTLTIDKVVYANARPFLDA
jgi:hypothetical protein